MIACQTRRVTSGVLPSVAEVSMADVVMSTRGVDVAYTDVEFDVKADGSVIGTLKVSRGTVEWRPKSYQYGFHLGWEDFGRLMEEHGTQR